MPKTTPVVGQPLVVEINFRLEGVLTDPVIVRCKIKPPTGLPREVVQGEAAMVKREVGVYEVSLIPDEPGTWAFQGVGQGGVDAVGEVVQHVDPSLVG